MTWDDEYHELYRLREFLREFDGSGIVRLEIIARDKHTGAVVGDGASPIWALELLAPEVELACESLQSTHRRME